MNSSINYSGFVEMFLNSDDEFEPYGCADSSMGTVTSGQADVRSQAKRQHLPTEQTPRED